MSHFKTHALFLFFFLAFTVARAEISISSVHCICGPEAPGGVTIVATGTAGPFTFQWSGPEGYTSTEQNPEDMIVPGMYMVAVINFYGCAVTLSTEVGACSVMDPLILTPTPACVGANTGSVDLEEPTTGTAPYTYSWSNSSAMSDINGLAPGEYQVTVTDYNQCTQEASVTVLSEQVLNLDATVVNTCSGDHNGSISLTVSGGIGEYDYEWHDEQYEANRNTLDPGIYNVTVTNRDIDNACKITGSFEVVANPLPVIASVEITPVTCANSGDGVITITVSGGAAPYMYQWNNGSTTNVADESEGNLNGADYCVVVKDFNLCTVTDCYSTIPTATQYTAPYVKRVKMFAAPILGGNGTETLIYDAEWITTPEGCVFFTGGTLDISPQLITAIDNMQRKLRIEAEVSEAMQPMSVGGHFFPPNTMANSSDNIWEATFSQTAFAAAVTNNVLFDQFTFIGQDLHDNPLFDLLADNEDLNKCVDLPQLQPNCTWSPPYVGANVDNVHVLERKCMQVSFDLNVVDGAIRAVVTGGQPAYSFKWTKEGYPDVVIGNDAIITEQIPGRYCVSITDAAGCSVQECVTLCLPIEEILLHTTVEIDPPCPGGIADGVICIVPESGINYTYPLTYQWEDGSSEACFSGVMEGDSYSVTITELTCMQPFVHHTDQILAAGPLSVAVSSSSPACPNASDGRLEVAASGGRAPYTYVWDNETTDAINTGLSAGICYSVTVTDVCGQTVVECFNLPVYTSVTITGATITPTGCSTSTIGRIQVTVTGGNTPMTFKWSNSDGSFTRTTLQGNLNNIGSGTYKVTITDACGNETISNPFVVGTNYTPLGTSGNNITPTCGVASTGSIKFTRTGGIPPFDYQWSGPNGPMPPTSVPFVNNLAQGNYAVTITDGCSETLVRTFVVGASSANTSIQVNITAITHICGAGQTGAIDLNTTSTGGNLSFVWSPGGATTQDVTGLSAGEHSVIISNGNCASTHHFNIEEPQWELEGITAPALCKNENGAVDVTVQGLASELSFDWTTGETTEDIGDLAAGMYCVTVTDGFNCMQSDCFEVEEGNTMLTINQQLITGSTTLELEPGYFSDLETGSINISVSGNHPPFSFVWSNGATSEDISDLASGTYTMTVTDAQGCREMRSFFVPVCNGSELVVYIYPQSVTPLSTAGGGGLAPTVYGENPSFSYSWQGPNGFSSSSMNLTGLTQPGEYCLTVTDKCNNTVSICREMITTCPVKALDIEVDNGCLEGEGGGDILLTAIGEHFANGNPHLSEHLYAEWSTGQTGLFRLEIDNEHQDIASVVWGNQSIHVTNENQGLYSVTVTDDFGCQYEAEVLLLDHTFEALIAYDIELQDISSEFNGSTERVIDEFRVCSTCGYIFDGRTYNLFACNHQHDEHILFFPFISQPNDGSANPCQRGGMIRIQDSPVHIDVDVMPNTIATFVKPTLNGGCGCIFPPEVFDDMPPYLYRGVFSQYSEPIYAEIQGACSSAPGQDPFANSYNLEGINHTCQCDMCFIVPHPTALCSYTVVCIDGETTTTENIHLGENIGYRKKLGSASTSVLVDELHDLNGVTVDDGTFEWWGEPPAGVSSDCIIYQVCNDNDPCAARKTIKRIPNSNCEEANISVDLGGQVYSLAEIEFLPQCPGLVGGEIDPPALNSTGPVDIPSRNIFSALVYPNPTTEMLNIQIYSPVPTTAKMQVYDIMGQMLFERIVEVDGQYSEQWEILDRFTPGVYRLSIRDNHGNFATHSVVITKK